MERKEREKIFLYDLRTAVLLLLSLYVYDDDEKPQYSMMFAEWGHGRVHLCTCGPSLSFTGVGVSVVAASFLFSAGTTYVVRVWVRKG